MTQHQFNLLVGEIRAGFTNMAETLSKRISWLERLAYSLIGAVIVISFLHNLGVLKVGK